MERQVSVMRRNSLLSGWAIWAILLLAPAAMLLAGCAGGTIDDDGGYDPGIIGFPQYRNLTIVLRVIDERGRAVGGASVWVDGREAQKRTDNRLYPLGSGYPREWQGWLANWTSDAYRVVINYPNDVDEFDIEVGKQGYWPDVTRVVIADWEPDEIFVRDVMVLEEKFGWLTSAAAPEREPRLAEVVAADTGYVRAPGSEPIITIGNE